MSDVSREEIEEKIKQLIDEEQSDVEELSFDDLTPIVTSDETGLDKLYEALESLRVEMKQINRMEKTRLETLKEFLDDEKVSKKQLTEKISQLVAQSERLKYKNMILSLIELKDFVEKSTHSIVLSSQNPKPAFSLFKSREIELRKLCGDTVGSILKKIDALIEREEIYPIHSDAVMFDPAQMMAVETTFNEERAENQILETIEKGYVYKNDVIRYAKVKVNKKPISGEKNDTGN